MVALVTADMFLKCNVKCVLKSNGLKGSQCMHDQGHPTGPLTANKLTI